MERKLEELMKIGDRDETIFTDIPISVSHQRTKNRISVPPDGNRREEARIPEYLLPRL